MTQLSEQISTLNERMDEFTSRIEELNSKLSCNKNSPTQQSLTLQAEVCNGSAPTSYFISGLDNGCLTNSIMPHSSSSSQLAKDSPLMEEVSNLTFLSFVNFGFYYICFETLSCCFWCTKPDIDNITWTASSDASVG